MSSPTSGSIRGTLVDRGTRSTLARWALSVRDGAREVATARTDGAGRFEIPIGAAWSDREVVLEARADGAKSPAARVGLVARGQVVLQLEAAAAVKGKALAHASVVAAEAKAARPARAPLARSSGDASPSSSSSAPDQSILLARGGSTTVVFAGLAPHATRTVRIGLDPASKPRMVRMRFESVAGALDPQFEITRLSPGDALVDLHESETSGWTKTVRADDLGALLARVATRASGGDLRISIDEIASACDVMITRANCAAGTEYETDPTLFTWTWISPDLMVDNDGDHGSDPLRTHGDNVIRVRLRNRGNADASQVQVELAWQPGSLAPAPDAWMPMTDAAGAAQSVAIPVLAAGAEAWFSVRFALPSFDPALTGVCIRAEAQVAGDPNGDNKVSVTRVGRIEPNGDPDVVDLMADEPDATGEVTTASHGGWTIHKEGGSSHALTSGAPASSGRLRVRIARASGLRRGVRAARPDPECMYPVDARALPPGLRGEDLVTVMRLVDGAIVGGMSFVVAPRGAPRSTPATRS